MRLWIVLIFDMGIFFFWTSPTEMNPVLKVSFHSFVQRYLRDCLPYDYDYADGQLSAKSLFWEENAKINRDWIFKSRIMGKRLHIGVCRNKKNPKNLYRFTRFWPTIEVCQITDHLHGQLRCMDQLPFLVRTWNMLSLFFQ